MMIESFRKRIRIDLVLVNGNLDKRQRSGPRVLCFFHYTGGLSWRPGGLDVLVLLASVSEAGFLFCGMRGLSSGHSM